MRYRSDIDGLRAIAVTTVVAYHAGIPGFGNGFVGVDIFFVISGFLITSLLLREQGESGRIDIAGFYARRVRRLLPALCVMLVATTVAAVFFLSPGSEQVDFARSAGAASTFLANIYFGHVRSGYFRGGTQDIPLLHTWSLGIEEQFYIVWPALIIGITALSLRWKLPPGRSLAVALAAGSVVSLILCLMLIDRAESFSFFFFPTRAWELGAGALLAFIPLAPGSRPRLGAVLSVLGAAAIAWVLIATRPTSVFNPVTALIAVVGAALILAGNARAPQGPVSRLLSVRPAVGLGKLSYSWYLWHWPLLAFARTWTMERVSLPRDIALVLIALGLSALTWRFVEEPVRRLKPGPFATTKGSLIAGGLMLALCAALAGGLWLWSLHQTKVDPVLGAAYRAQRHRVELEHNCDGMGGTTVRPPSVTVCGIGLAKDRPLVAVWGDSHAVHLVPGLADAAAGSGIAILPRTRTGCRFAPATTGADNDAVARKAARCGAFSDAVAAELPSLKSTHNLKGVIVSARWGARDGWRTGLEPRVRSARAQGLRVVLALDVPFYPVSVPRCAARRGVEACEGLRAEVEKGRAEEVAILRRIAGDDPGIRIWDPAQTLCATGRCTIFANGEGLYSDNGHLTYAGSRYLSDAATPMLEWAAGRDVVEPRSPALAAPVNRSY